MKIKRRELTKVVNLINGELRANSRIIATLLKVEHEGFVKLLYRNEEHFNEFGAVRFEVGSRSDENTGGKQPKTYLLTEDQCYFALTLVRNTPQAIELKKRLVHEFSEARGNPRYQAEKKVQVLKQQIFSLENEPLTLQGFAQLSLKDRKKQRSQIWEIWRKTHATSRALNYRRIQVAKEVNLIINGMTSYRFRQLTGAGGLMRDWMPLANQYCFYLVEHDLLNLLRRRNWDVDFEYIERVYPELANVAKTRVELMYDLELDSSIEDEVNQILNHVRQQVVANVTPYLQTEAQVLNYQHLLVDELERLEDLMEQPEFIEHQVK